jgi:hypothetical protein
MIISNWLDRFANTIVLGVLLCGLPLAAIGFLAHSL